MVLKVSLLAVSFSNTAWSPEVPRSIAIFSLVARNKGIIWGDVVKNANWVSLCVKKTLIRTSRTTVLGGVKHNY